ncbi:MAG: UDP-N-acetylmuramoyl-L-alanine--D-glutamate ligase [Desulfuromonadaceae bacterium]|nr:UDP-N-acetylmuramoyl-L-alanine--D-glutamate ligase [Desulfuromonadaceae bacterium]
MIRGSNIVVVGAARSGLALARYLAAQGGRVTLSDQRAAANLAGLEGLAELEVAFDLAGHSEACFSAADLIVISPGVPLTQPLLAAAVRRGTPVIGEIELAFEELRAPMVAVAGTNGKSTVTTLIGLIFSCWGKKTFVGGNLGMPLICAAEEKGWDWIVAEVSSFQLEAILTFRPRYGLMLNITEDHLDRYPNMGAYTAAKANLFLNMESSDTAVLNADDPLVMELAGRVRAQRVLFSSRQELPQGIGFNGSEIVWCWQGEERRFAAAELRLRGLHNVENVMAALVPALLEGCPPSLAWEAVCSFGGLEHRMVLVRTLDGVAWYNDSKGTNVGSVVKSLAGLASPVTLIAGGKDKGGDYAPLRQPLRDKVAHLILIGEAASRMEEALLDATHVVRAAGLREAVDLARELTPFGGSVLLSPACSSFDMFTSFEDRGRQFSELVLGLEERKDAAASGGAG